MSVTRIKRPPRLSIDVVSRSLNRSVATPPVPWFVALVFIITSNGLFGRPASIQTQEGAALPDEAMLDQRCALPTSTSVGGTEFE